MAARSRAELELEFAEEELEALESGPRPARAGARDRIPSLDEPTPGQLRRHAPPSSPSIEPRFLGSLTIRLGGLLVFATALMMFLDVPLQGEASPPCGIVSFELAGTPHRALRILLEWKSSRRAWHRASSSNRDFVYLVIYAMFFASLALL